MKVCLQKLTSFCFELPKFAFSTAEFLPKFALFCKQIFTNFVQLFGFVIVLIYQNSPHFVNKISRYFQLSKVKIIRESLFTKQGEFWFCYCFDLPKFALAADILLICKQTLTDFIYDFNFFQVMDSLALPDVEKQPFYQQLWA